VFTRHSFHHLLEPATGLVEMVLVCSPGGRVVVVDVFTSNPDQAEAFNRLEKLRNPSHVRALTLHELTALVTRSGLRHVRTQLYKHEFELAPVLQRSFPNPGDADVIRRMFADYLGVNRLAACAQGKRVRFWRVTELITALREADEDRHLARLRGHLAKLDLLVLDEFGYVPASKAGAELLFDVIARAYERSSIVLTTNLPFEHWTEVLGNERLTGAALDRLTHRCTIVETTGESYRLQDAKRRRRSEPKT